MKKIKQKWCPKVLILDVDGVFTDGKFYYTTEGKVMKQFGPEDNDGLTLLQGMIEIRCVTGDKRGYAITKKRIEEDMGLKLDLVSTHKRIEWIAQHYSAKDVIYMGDGIFDPLVFKHIGYSIAPQNAFFTTKKQANFVTNSKGGEGAVAEACVHVLEVFFDTKFDVHNLNLEHGSGAWKT